jgi:DNA-binding NarL/FixJ family response regulator
METVKVFLADDHALFRKALASLLATREGVQVVGEAEDGCQTIDMVREIMPDVILMDVHMPKCNGMKAVRRIKATMPDVLIIMLTVDEHDEILFESIKSGAQGYLLKKLGPQHLFDTLEKVARGEVALSPAIMAKILTEFQRPPTESDGAEGARERLTPREMEVLKRVVRGATNHEIAEALSITENTTKKHVRSILSKLHLQNRVQAAVYAVQEGLVNGSKPAT